MTAYLTKYITPPSIEKPLYDGKKGYKIFIWDKYIKQAERYNKKLLLRAKDENGATHKAIYTPAEWLDGAEYMEKVFLRPDEPMKMWGNYLVPSRGMRNEDVRVNISVFERLAENKDLMRKLGRNLL